MIKRFLADFPTTPAVVLTGIVLALTTALRYQLSGVHISFKGASFGFAVWEPNGDWLLFVTGFATVATAHFGWKRSTDKGYVEAKAQTQSPVTVEAGTVNIEEARG